MAGQATSRSRLTLDLSHRLGEQLERLAAERGVTKAEVLRDAIELLIRADRAVQEGLTVGAWKKDETNNVVKEREFTGVGLL